MNTKAQIATYKNNIVLLIDASSSMKKHESSVKEFVKNHIELMRRRSTETGQETRLSVYQFADTCNCIVFDSDVLRPINIDDFYKPYGNTAIIKSVDEVLNDLAKIPQLYHDNSFLVQVVSDGEENASRGITPQQLAKRISSLPENYTLACLVPNATASHYAKQCGFSAGNIEVWNTDSKAGFEEMARTSTSSINNYYTLRSQGVRGSKNLFKVNTNIKSTDVKKNLDQLDPDKYHLLPISKESPIKDFVEGWKIQYTPGSAYYELVKPEKVQYHKQICLRNRLNGKVFVGANVRKMLNLPDHEVKVEPASINDYQIFVQSTSTNRKLTPGTSLIVMK